MIARLKRNPVLLAFLMLVLIAGLWFAWWTISPLFIRTTLVEGDNISIPGAGTQNSDGVTTEAKGDSMVAGTMKDATMPDTIVATGSFDRIDDVHYASGQAILVKQADGSMSLRLQDLNAANGPDLYIYLSEHPNPGTGEQLHEGGEYNLGSLKATTGSFNYDIDPSIDLSKIKSVVIYCRAFSVIFSVAGLEVN